MQSDAVVNKSDAASGWFGYGRWGAPYWFIGKEPGGSDDPEQYASWRRLGGAELIDCREHDLDCPSTGRAPGLWHGGESPPLQRTWRPLIAMVLAYEGAASYDEAAVRKYQDEAWGRLDGNTAVVELSAVAAPSVSHSEKMRLFQIDERINTIREHLRHTAPEFVVFYGLGTDPVHNVPYLRHWRRIADADLEVGEPVQVGKTIFVADRHPTAHGTTTQHWLDLGRRLRALHDRTTGSAPSTSSA